MAHFIASTFKLIEKLLDNARKIGNHMLKRLREMKRKHPIIIDVRGLGLMIGVEFQTIDRKPDKTTTKAVVQACFEKNLMLLTCGTYDNVIRWIPPLIVTEQQIEEAVGIFADSLKSVIS